LGKWEIFGFSYFHRSTLLDKKLVIGQILGNWEILVNWKIQICPISQNQMEIGHWKIRESEMVGASFSK
jgi:hypothetical protein